VDTNRFSE